MAHLNSPLQPRVATNDYSLTWVTRMRGNFPHYIFGDAMGYVNKRKKTEKGGRKGCEVDRANWSGVGGYLVNIGLKFTSVIVYDIQLSDKPCNQRNFTNVFLHSKYTSCICKVNFQHLLPVSLKNLNFFSIQVFVPLSVISVCWCPPLCRE